MSAETPADSSPSPPSSQDSGEGCVCVLGLLFGAISGYRGSYLAMLPWSAGGLVIGFVLGIGLGLASGELLKSLPKAIGHAAIIGLNYALTGFLIASLVGSLVCIGDPLRDGWQTAVVGGIAAYVRSFLVRRWTYPLVASVVTSLKADLCGDAESPS